MTKVATTIIRNWLTVSVKYWLLRVGSQWRTSRIMDNMLSNFRFRAIDLGAVATLSTPCSCLG